MIHLRFLLSVLSLLLLTTDGVGKEFIYQNIPYTVLDEEAKTCQIKARERGKPSIQHTDKTLIIPETVTDGEKTYTVVGVGQAAFMHNKKLTSISLPNSIRCIDAFAFSGCLNLKYVHLPSELDSILMDAFSRCKFSSIDLPSKLSYIGSIAFNGCENLKSVTLPASLTHLSYMAFTYCENLQRIDVDAENKHFSSVDGVIFSKDKSTLFIYPDGKEGNYNVPSSVKYIHRSAFSSTTKVDSVQIPNSVEKIGDAIFLFSNVKFVKLPNSIDEIPWETFHGSRISEIIFPTERPLTICVWAFRDCDNLNEITLPRNVEAIEEVAFEGSSLKKLTIENPGLRLEKDSFKSCKKLRSIILKGQIVQNPAITADVKPFDDKTYENATLYVEPQMLQIAKTTLPWSNFKHIEELTDN